MDNQNTNRNETCMVPTCIELVTASGNGVSEADVKLQVQDCDVESDETATLTIPSVIITAPSDENENEMSDESSHMVKASADEINVIETKSEEAVEEEKPLESNSGVDTCTTSDEEFEVICRCSSTPVSTNSESQAAAQSPKSEMSTTDEPTTPKKEGEEEEVEEGKGEEKEDSGGAEQSQGAVYVPPQYLAPPPQNEEPKAHMPPEYANAQAAATFEMGTVTTFAQQPPVYSLPAGTVAYVGAQQPSVTYASYQQDGVCQQLQMATNGYNASFVPRADQGFAEETQRADALQNPGDATVPFQPASEMYNFVYPSIYVSNAGLISVLLRHDMSVEMTVDRTIRVVSHQHMMAVATDSRGTSACLYHPALKVIQQGTTTDIATEAVRVHMGHDEVAFAVGNKPYRFDTHDVQPVSQVKFSDVSKDQSVNLLFSSEGYGENLVPQCLEVASKAEYANLPKGGVIVRINGVKVTQNGGGDVTVVTGAKFIRLSPSFGMTRLGNRFIDIEIERDWSSRVSRGPHCFLAGERRVLISNGKLEVDVNEHGRFKVTHLQPRRPATPQQCLRPEQLARRVNSVTCNTSPGTRPSLARTPPPPRRRSAPVGVSR